MTNNKMHLKLSAIAISILLASCGGGGSDGYFEGGNSGSGTTTPPTTSEAVKTNYHLVISSNKPSMLISGDIATITIKLVDENGGGVVDQDVTLAIEDTITNGITIDGASKVKTDTSGNANFNIKLDAQNIKDKAALLAKGIRFNASFTDGTKKTITQTTILKALESINSETSTAQYFLNMSTNKPTLLVTGDNAKVTIKAVDVNGGGVEGQTVTLAIQDTLKNGVTIDGSSKALTDTSGNAVFNISLPAATGTNATNLLANGITLNAELTDANGVTSKQSTKISVVSAAVAQPIGNITFGNSGELQKTADANYYSEAASAHVVDINGKPLANQTVTLSLKVLSAGTGVFYLKKGLDQAKDGQVLTLKSTLADPKLTDAEKVQIEALIEALEKFENDGRDQNYCQLNDLKNTQLATGFVSPTGEINTTFTYTTDSTGKFDFRVNYLRRYAGWQSVEITAKTSVSGKTLQSSMNYRLGILKTDLDAETSQPFDTSPYGNECNNYSFPWSYLLK